MTDNPDVEAIIDDLLDRAYDDGQNQRDNSDLIGAIKIIRTAQEKGLLE
jgi:hypothetical protein